MNVETFIPTALAFASGMLAPVLVEKWKGSKREAERLVSIENNLSMLRADLEKTSSLEERIRDLEKEISKFPGMKEDIDELFEIEERLRGVEKTVGEITAIKHDIEDLSDLDERVRALEKASGDISAIKEDIEDLSAFEERIRALEMVSSRNSAILSVRMGEATAAEVSALEAA